MKQLVPILVCAGLSVGEATAQQVIPPLKKEFLDSAWHVLPSAEGARYRRETEYRDSTAGEVRDYYLSGQLQSRGSYEHIRRDIVHGTYETWYASGQLQSHAEFSHGQYAGEVREYYPTGQLKRQEQYAANRLVGGGCFGADGQPNPCSPLVYVEVMPVYPEGDGGTKAIVAAVGQNFEYPRKALKTNTTGRVLVKFAVDEHGNVADAQVVQSLSPEVDAAALRAVRKLRRFRPGTQQGKPIKVYFTVPLNLAIQ